MFKEIDRGEAVEWKVPYLWCFQDMYITFGVIFSIFQKFFHEKRYIKKLSAYCKKLKDAVEKCRPTLSEEEQNNINEYLQNISKDFEEILQRMQADEQKLENIHRCWSEFNRAVELSLPWLVEAERLLKEGETDQCKV